MENSWITDRIKNQIEALILESILAVLNNLTDQIIAIKGTGAKPIIRPEEKF